MKTKLFGLLAGISIYRALSWLTAATTITSATFSFGGL
jgi:hypothetical protein